MIEGTVALHMQAFILRSFLLALASCLLGMGLILLPQFTLSPRSVTHTIDRFDGCLYQGDNWDCKKPSKVDSPLQDPGAVAWVEIPQTQLAHDFGPLTSWNPYIGAGYPEFLSGHFRASSFSRLFLSLFPTDQARDFVIFMRFLLWSFAFALLVGLLGVSPWWQFFAALASPLLPYVASYLDHVFLDVDMLAPWLLLWVAIAHLKAKAFTPMQWKLFSIFSLLFGLWIGAQSFLEAQVVFLLVAGLLIVISLPKVGQKLIVPAALLCAGTLVAMAPEVYKFLLYFPELVSSRLPGSCQISRAIGSPELAEGLWLGLFKNQHSPYIIASGVGIPFFVSTFFSRNWRWLGVAGLCLAASIVLGLPQVFCGIRGLNGVHFFRHVTVYAQSLFLLSLFSGMVTVHEFFPKDRKLKYLISFFLIVAVVSFVKKGFVNERAVKSKELAQIEHGAKPPTAHFVSYLQDASQTQNRRHISVDLNLFPNWSSIYHIYDVRILEALYPRFTYELLAQILPQWLSGSGVAEKPDRFVFSSQPWDESWERFLRIFRVSLISHKEGLSFLPATGPISQSSCQRVSRDQQMTIWDCPQLGRIDFFAKKVLQVPQDQVITQLLHLPVQDLQDLAILASEDLLSLGEKYLQPGQGVIQKVEKNADQYDYDISVSQDGLFVLADSYFPGWRASLDGKPSPIVRVNHAFKGIYLPRGQIHLRVWYSPLK